VTTTSDVFARRRRRGVLLLSAVCVTAACATTGAPVAGPAAPDVANVPIDQKVGWILRLEQQRVLRDPGVLAATLPAPPEAVEAGGEPVALPPPAFSPAVTADLGALLLDPDPGIRRRAALAIGRADVPEGLPWLTHALADPDEDVRAMAAFGLGTLPNVLAISAWFKYVTAAAKGRLARALIASVIAAVGVFGILKATQPAAVSFLGQCLDIPGVAALFGGH